MSQNRFHFAPRPVHLAHQDVRRQTRVEMRRQDQEGNNGNRRGLCTLPTKTAPVVQVISSTLRQRSRVKLALPVQPGQRLETALFYRSPGQCYPMISTCQQPTSLSFGKHPPIVVTPNRSWKWRTTRFTGDGSSCRWRSDVKMQPSKNSTSFTQLCTLPDLMVRYPPTERTPIRLSCVGKASTRVT